MTKDIGVLSKWLTRPEKDWNPHDNDREVPWDSLGKDDEDEEDDDKGKERTPWLLAGRAFLLAAVCGGLALGVLCTSSIVLYAGIRPQRLATNPGDEEGNPETLSYRRFEELELKQTSVSPLPNTIKLASARFAPHVAFEGH